MACPRWVSISGTRLFRLGARRSSTAGHELRGVSASLGAAGPWAAAGAAGAPIDGRLVDLAPSPMMIWNQRSLLRTTRNTFSSCIAATLGVKPEPFVKSCVETQTAPRVSWQILQSVGIGTISLSATWMAGFLVSACRFLRAFAGRDLHDRRHANHIRCRVRCRGRRWRPRRDVGSNSALPTPASPVRRNSRWLAGCARRRNRRLRITGDLRRGTSDRVSLTAWHCPQAGTPNARFALALAKSLEIAKRISRVGEPVALTDDFFVDERAVGQKQIGKSAPVSIVASLVVFEAHAASADQSLQELRGFPRKRFNGP